VHSPVCRFVVAVMLVGAVVSKTVAQDSGTKAQSQVPGAGQSSKATCNDEADDHCEEAAKKSEVVVRTSGNTELPIKNRLMVVGSPKVYDDLYLRGLLSSLQNQLANTHVIDQATLLSHIGVAQGADLRQTSAAISASGPPTPQTQTFSLAPGVPAFSYPPGYPGTAASTAFPTGTATTTTPGTTTTMNSVTPTAPVPTTPTLAPPAISSLGQSSLDTYNESLQLSAEITNTTLLLQGALSDALQPGGAPKTTVTVGFPITVGTPSLADKDLAGAVAEVHVAICSNDAFKTADGKLIVPPADLPSIVTLLPQERTYNVASLVEKDFVGSASAILGGVINVGGGLFWSHKRYYLVQQQETVAFLSADRNPDRCGGQHPYVGFAWQIRPVLGNQFIRPGNSVNFVQFAVPQVIDTGAPTTLVGQACVSVVWRKPAVTGWFGKKSDQYLEDLAPTGEPPDEKCFDIDYYNTLAPENKSLSVTDIGQGAVTVLATGTFLPGTTVRLGNTYLPPDNITATHDALEFTAPASAIAAAGQVYFVGRDGREIEAIHVETQAPAHGLTIKGLSISPYSDTQSLVKIEYEPPPPFLTGGVHNARSINPAIDPWVVVIGGKVFGLSDAPFFAKIDSFNGLHQIQVIVPTSLIQTSPTVELRRLLWQDKYFRTSRPISADTFSKAAPSVSTASIVSTQKGLTIGLVGTGLDKLRLVFPSKDACPTCDAQSSGSTFLKVTLPKPPEAKKTNTKDEAKDAKESAPDPTDGLRQLVFCRVEASTSLKCEDNFPPVIVDVPKIDAPTPKPSLDKHDPVLVGTPQVVVTGKMLEQVVSIEHAKASLNFRLLQGKSPSLVVDLPPAIAAVPGGYSLLVTFADKSTVAYLLMVQKKGP
jgi:hypothetical protein